MYRSRRRHATLQITWKSHREARLALIGMQRKRKWRTRRRSRATVPRHGGSRFTSWSAVTRCVRVLPPADEHYYSKWMPEVARAREKIKAEKNLKCLNATPE